MKNLCICGLQKTTLLDYPGHVAATVFLGGCNFRCPFCHNATLLGSQLSPAYSAQEVLCFLEKRQTILEGVCITGGEPTLQAEALEDFLKSIRALGLLIKLDTNGTRPEVLQNLAREGLLDFVSMDIKAGPSNYANACGIPNGALDAVKESAAWLKSGTLPFEFRTTVVKGLHTMEDFLEIGPWIQGCSHYYLQNYVASDRVLSPHGFSAFSQEELSAFSKCVKPYVGAVSLRGVDG